MGTKLAQWAEQRREELEAESKAAAEETLAERKVQQQPEAVKLTVAVTDGKESYTYFDGFEETTGEIKDNAQFCEINLVAYHRAQELGVGLRDTLNYSTDKYDEVTDADIEMMEKSLRKYRGYEG